MNLFSFWLKEKTVDPVPATVGPTEDAPVQEALDVILDAIAAATARRPILHAGAVGLKEFVDLVAPGVRAALAAAGFKIVKV